MILYVIIGLALVSFVFAFLSAKTWHWGYVVLVELIFLTSMGFFILAAESLRINAVLRSNLNKIEKEAKQLTADVDGLKFGTSDAAVLNRLRAGDPAVVMAEDATSIPSIEELDHKLLITTRRRGRVWRYADPAGFDPRTGAVRVTFRAPPRPAPAPADGTEPPATPPAATPTPVLGGLKADTIVYVFEDGPPRAVAPGAQGGPGLQFLGEFTVSQSAGANATLQLTQPFEPTDRESRRLSTSRGPWVVYETMPMDRFEIYAGFTEEQLKQLLPKDTVNEYLKHGKEAGVDDDPARRIGVDENNALIPPGSSTAAVKTLYQRRRRDYAGEFDEAIRQRIAMRADIDAVKRDIEDLTAAEEVAKKIQTFRTAERQKLTADLAGVTKEREAIEKHLRDVEQLLAKARDLTAQLLEHNRQLAAQLAAKQRAANPAGRGAAPPAKPTPPLASAK